MVATTSFWSLAWARGRMSPLICWPFRVRVLMPLLFPSGFWMVMWAQAGVLVEGVAAGGIGVQREIFVLPEEVEPGKGRVGTRDNVFTICIVEVAVGIGHKWVVGRWVLGSRLWVLGGGYGVTGGAGWWSCLPTTERSDMFRRAASQVSIEDLGTSGAKTIARMGTDG